MSFDLDVKAIAFNALFKTIYNKTPWLQQTCDALWDQNNQSELWLLCSEMVNCVVILALVVGERTTGIKVLRSKST